MVKPLGTTYHVSWIHRLVQGSDVPRRVHSWIHCLVQGSDIPGRVHSWVHRLVQGSDIPGRSIPGSTTSCRAVTFPGESACPTLAPSLGRPQRSALPAAERREFGSHIRGPGRGQTSCLLVSVRGGSKG